MIKDQTKLRILDAACQCFARLGWIGTTTQKIARVAGVNECTLFRHFGSKNQLFSAMVGSYVDVPKEILCPTIMLNASLEKFLFQFAEIYFQTLGNNPDYTRAMLSEMSRLPVEVRHVVVDMVNPLRQQFIAFLELCKKRDEIRREVNSEAVMDAFTGMLLSNIIKPRFSNPAITREEFIGFCVELFLRGLKP